MSFSEQEVYYFTHQLTLDVLTTYQLFTLLTDVNFESIAVVDQFISTVLRKSLAFLMQGDAFALQRNTLIMQPTTLTLQRDTLTLYQDALALQRDALTLD
ncbi:hypothetical protein PQG02_18665 [Nostoc sp. UHCC 0926]|uniref:hypothetical protein n=1 Tax=unclassified Nostoc TaxID=2593658 RepID=UPI002360A98B|nr:hypothetical protein [Nostoc sp. UHCC 0926]WDD30767.1 hypothetical protein PQG02_18665 [Nostoc sp. UHCC 0926]